MLRRCVSGTLRRIFPPRRTRRRAWFLALVNLYSTRYLKGHVIRMTSIYLRVHRSCVTGTRLKHYYKTLTICTCYTSFRHQSGACVASMLPPLCIAFLPLHPWQLLTAVMLSPNHLFNPSTPSPLPGACVPATAGTHAGLLERRYNSSNFSGVKVFQRLPVTSVILQWGWSLQRCPETVRALRIMLPSVPSLPDGEYLAEALLREHSTVLDIKNYMMKIKPRLETHNLSTQHIGKVRIGFIRYNDHEVFFCVSAHQKGFAQNGLPPSIVARVWVQGLSRLIFETGPVTVLPYSRYDQTRSVPVVRVWSRTEMGYVRGGYTLRRTLIFVHHTGHSNLA